MAEATAKHRGPIDTIELVKQVRSDPKLPTFLRYAVITAGRDGSVSFSIELDCYISAKQLDRAESEGPIACVDLVGSQISETLRRASTDWEAHLSK